MNDDSGAIVTVVVIAVICLAALFIPGCPSDFAPKEKTKSVDEVVAENAAIEQRIDKLHLGDEHPIYFQEELRGTKGKIDGSWSGNSMYQSGEISGETDNARSISFYWRGTDGVLNPITLPQDKFVILPREGKRSGVKFNLDLPDRWTDANIRVELKQEHDPAMSAYAEASMYSSKLFAIESCIADWRQIVDHPSVEVKNRLDMATVYATRVDLKRYNGLTIPPDK